MCCLANRRCSRITLRLSFPWKILDPFEEYWAEHHIMPDAYAPGSCPGNCGSAHGSRRTCLEATVIVQMENTTTIYREETALAAGRERCGHAGTRAHTGHPGPRVIRKWRSRPRTLRVTSTCWIIVHVAHSENEATRLDAQLRMGGDAGASEVIIPCTVTANLLVLTETLISALLLPDALIVAWWLPRFPGLPR